MLHAYTYVEFLTCYIGVRAKGQTIYIPPNIRYVIGDFIQTIGLITEIPVGPVGGNTPVPLKKLIMRAPKDIQFFGTLRINLTVTDHARPQGYTVLWNIEN
jgi:hypothetical protein